MNLLYVDDVYSMHSYEALLVASSPLLKVLSAAASSSSDPYTLDESSQWVIWLTCSDGPGKQSILGAVMERGKLMHSSVNLGSLDGMGMGKHSTRSSSERRGKRPPGQQLMPGEPSS